jgi:hypothetical protein
MKVAKITKENLAWGEQEGAALKERYRRNPKSITKGQRIPLEKAVIKTVCESMGWELADTFNNDAVWTLPNGQKRKVEIKVVMRNVGVRGDYNAHVAAYNTSQDCDYLCFVSAKKEEEVEICGLISRADFFDNAVKAKKGDKDGPAGLQNSGGFPCDCYNMPYNHPKMRPIGKKPIPE